MSLPGGSCELDAMARRVSEGNRYMTLGTVEPDGAPRLSPVYYTPARHTDFYWVSSPEARHSRNIAVRPQVRIVIFDSTAPIGEGEAVYLSALARSVGADELERVRGEAFRACGGARAFAPEELREPARCASMWPPRRAGRCTSQDATPSTPAPSTSACPPPPRGRPERRAGRAAQRPGHGRRSAAAACPIDMARTNKD